MFESRETIVRRFYCVMGAALLVGCGTIRDIVNADRPVGTGGIEVLLDRSCAGPQSIDVIVDGSVVGTDTLVSGGESKIYRLGVGSHAVSARASAPGTQVWPTRSVEVGSDVLLITPLTCP
jgi:hypothetical protein